jgi:shikimate kinase
MGTVDDRNIILIGYRGTGKTAVGQELARRLRRPFCDSDAIVEAREGRSIREIVDQKGWPFFRELEKAAILSLSETSRCIVATGGGAVMDPENARLLKSMGWIVLLTAAEDVLVRRIRADAASREKRPSFSGKASAEVTEQEMLAETKEILKRRLPVYQQLADLIVDTAQSSPAEVAERILLHFSADC